MGGTVILRCRWCLAVGATVSVTIIAAVITGRITARGRRWRRPVLEGNQAKPNGVAESGQLAAYLLHRSQNLGLRNENHLFV